MWTRKSIHRSCAFPLLTAASRLNSTENWELAQLFLNGKVYGKTNYIISKWVRYKVIQLYMYIFLNIFIFYFLRWDKNVSVKCQHVGYTNVTRCEPFSIHSPAVESLWREWPTSGILNIYVKFLKSCLLGSMRTFKLMRNKGMNTLAYLGAKCLILLN